LLLHSLSRLWTSINERKIVQWSIGYVALAYSVQHGVVLTGEAFEWPHEVVRISMLLLSLGLPMVVTIAWYHGDKGSQRISGPELSIISILLVIGSLLFFVFVKPSEEHGPIAAPSHQLEGAASDAPLAAPAGAVSIAVLPFVNLSSDAEQEFFSDGMTEEITSALAKVPGLTVIGRTSAFQFKGDNRDLRMIGRALGTTHLIEGSVRKAGSRVRITAQLIVAESGAHLWTQSMIAN
jgi:TolB-like protein